MTPANDALPKRIWDVALRIWAEMRTVNHDAPIDHARGDVEEIAMELLKAETQGMNVPRFDRTRCATEGCGNLATDYFERGGVGSHHCEDCSAKIAALTQA